MSNNISISIIIPFYNTKKEYFNRCIKSVMKQTYDNYEVIIINDGSEPEYKNMLDRIEKTDNRIRVIHKKNEGSAIARNVGLLEAKCDYIMFLDADDALTDYCLEEANDCISKYSADLVIGLAKKTNENDINRIVPRYTGDLTCINTKSGKNELLSHMLGLHSSKFIFEAGYIGDGPWCRVVRTKIAQEALFSKESFWSDDTIWNIKMLKKCNNIIVAHDLWYKYLIYDGSKIRKFRPNCEKEFVFRTNQELKLGKKLWPNAMDGIYTRVFNDAVILARTFVFHPDNPMSCVQRYKSYKRCIHTGTYREAVKKVNLSNDSFVKRLIKRVFCISVYSGPNIISFMMLKLFIKVRNT